MIVDSHIHLGGHETWREVVEGLDGAGVDAACLIGPFLDPVSWIPQRGETLRWANEHLLSLCGEAPDRLWALVTVDPLDPRAPDEVLRFGDDPRVRGVKLIPHDWDPADVRTVLAACEAVRLPILFHSGIFISGRCSDRCRPARFEVVRDYPHLTVVLAHMAWPWVDEAIAVALMDLLRRQRPQIVLDTSPGTPEIYRDEALRKAFTVLGRELLLFGSDVFCPFDPARVRWRIDTDSGMLSTHGRSADDLAAYLGGNALRVFAPRIG